MLQIQTLPGSLSVQFVQPHFLKLEDNGINLVYSHLGGLLAPNNPELFINWHKMLLRREIKS